MKEGSHVQDFRHHSRRPRRRRLCCRRSAVCACQAPRQESLRVRDVLHAVEGDSEEGRDGAERALRVRDVLHADEGDSEEGREGAEREEGGVEQQRQPPRRLSNAYTRGCQNGTVSDRTMGGDNNNYEYYGDVCTVSAPADPAPSVLGASGQTVTPAAGHTVFMFDNNTNYEYYGNPSGS